MIWKTLRKALNLYITYLHLTLVRKFVLFIIFRFIC